MKPTWDGAYARKADVFATSEWWNSEADYVISLLANEGTLLDLGCNTGRFIQRAQRWLGGVQFIGVDINEEGLKIARSRLPTVEFYRTANDLPQGSLDQVVFMHAINQVEDLGGVLGPVWDAMKPKARIVVITHNPWYFRMHSLLKLFSGYKSDATMVREPTAGQLTQLMYEHGFRAISCTGLGPGWVQPRIVFVGEKP